MLGCFVVNSWRNHAYQLSKTFENLWSPWEYEECRFKMPQKTLQREKFCSQFVIHLTYKQTPKKAKKQAFLALNDTHMRPTHRRRSQVPRNHHSHAHGYRRLLPGSCALRPKTLFYDFFVKKARAFSPKTGGNFLYKYRIPHSQLFI